MDARRGLRMTTKDRILQAAVRLSLLSSYRDPSRSKVARLAQCSENLVSHHFGDMDGLRDAVITHGVKYSIPALVAQGVACKDPIALEAPPHVREAATEFLRDA